MLASAEGQSDNAIARSLAVNRKTVTLWRERFAEQGLDSMWEVAAGRGRKPISYSILITAGWCFSFLSGRSAQRQGISQATY